ncbi:MAG: hypothetical protein R3Y53_10135, partial [Bacillota bacterium]
MIRIFDKSLDNVLEVILDRMYQEMKNTYKSDKIILWGAGELGHSLYDLFRSADVEIFAYCDNNEKLWGGTPINGLPILSPDELKKMVDDGEDITVQIAFDNIHNDTIIEQIKSLGVENYLEHKQEIFTPFHFIKNTDEFKENQAIASILKTQKLNLLSINQRQLMFKEYINSGERDSVFICMVGKTGDVTLENTFRPMNIPFHNVVHTPEALDINLLPNANKKIKIITAVREPISHMLSNIYQQIGIASIQFCTTYHKELFVDGSDVQKIFNKFGSNCYKNTGSYSFVPKFLERFAENALDVMRVPFDKERGFTIIKEGNIEVFAYTLEKMNDIVLDLSKFVRGGG